MGIQFLGHRYNNNIIMRSTSITCNKEDSPLVGIKSSINRHDSGPKKLWKEK
jgi:hypothetical protein